MTQKNSITEFEHKWWGWGIESVEYDMDSRPNLWPFVCRYLEVDKKSPLLMKVALDAIVLPERKVSEELELNLLDRIGQESFGYSHIERVKHSYGRSFRDLVRLRAGEVKTAPDYIVYPESHEHVEAVMEIALKFNCVVIPFGGGTNIVGATEVDKNEQRVVICLDLKKMSQLLQLDEKSRVAKFQAGTFGPQIEEALKKKGFTLGHHPDSFMYSTLGGWLATRSAGSHSNKYGKIEDMCQGMKVVTAMGTVDLKSTPASSIGPEISRVFIGSEGRLGVITEASMKVSPLPEFNKMDLLLFKNYNEAVRAILECCQAECKPSMVRLSDEMETQLIFAAKHGSSKAYDLLKAFMKVWLKNTGYHDPSILIIGFEGNRELTSGKRKKALKIMKKYSSFSLGEKGALEWLKTRYDPPLLRDYLLDYGMICDTFETSTHWSNVLPLYESVSLKIKEFCREEMGHEPYLGNHISHVYDTGACLYWTVGISSQANSSPSEVIDQYVKIKHFATQAIVDHGGVVSHHHSIGYEHLPWLEKDVSTAGLMSLRKLKSAWDPDSQLNPGGFGK